MKEKKYRRIMGHLICESLGYLTPTAAKEWINYYKEEKEYYCEWVYDMLLKGLKNPTKYVLKSAIKNRHYHKGSMKNYKIAKQLVDDYFDKNISPQFASWF
ncbi:hypothetical protein [Thermosipho sp. (in: thermotogales)]|jgi:hypothetical protein|uniref:hypothetical protein n=1 Tax=Thermosipho sp. (in: thermotogales) TaxID=1968895 RepID=UPI00257F767C|nr:hypothetical protein [Thermosipho sp. (in: thermotogales)]MBZ4649215.1 hypothetical protein [Thermosipho sp. (in: thermotogales)]